MQLLSLWWLWCLIFFLHYFPEVFCLFVGIFRHLNQSFLAIFTCFKVTKINKKTQTVKIRHLQKVNSGLTQIAWARSYTIFYTLSNQAVINQFWTKLLPKVTYWLIVLNKLFVGREAIVFLLSNSDCSQVPFSSS